MLLLFRWQSTIHSLIQNSTILHPLQSTMRPNQLDSPRLLIFVNPRSGPGGALKNFNTRIRSFLGEANISYDLVVTDHVGHCQKVVEEQDLSKYIGIVTVSGDGLLFEVLYLTTKAFSII